MADSNYRINPDHRARERLETEIESARPALPGEIPVIDFQQFRQGNAQSRKQLAMDVADACERIGFFYLVNHGVPRDVTDGAFDHARRFFELPAKDKARLAYNKIQRGYKAEGTITIPGHPPDSKEVFDMGVELPADHEHVLAGRPLHGPNQWPPDPEFRRAMERYFDQVSSLGHSLLPLFAMALDLEPDYFNPYHVNPFITWRIMRYPPGTGAPGQYGTAPHTDFGTLTLLSQDNNGGLQLCIRSGEWVDAPVVPDSFVVNIGDMMSCWTNDRFTSTPHRVINSSGSQRYSIPMFFNPSFDTVAECLPTCHGPDNPPRYEPIHYGEYLTRIYGRIFAPVEDN